MAAWSISKESYVATCQYLLLCLVVATVVIAVAGVARLDIVGPHASTPTNQTVHSGPTQGSPATPASH